MSLQKYRCDGYRNQQDGAACHYANWIGGQSLAKVTNCRWESLAGDVRVTAYVQGEPDTFFSIPAKVRYLGRTVTGYLTSDDEGNTVFHHCYFE